MQLNHWRLMLLLLLALLSMLHSAALQAANIRVVTEYRSYYQLQNSDGSLGGYATEVVQALFALTGDTPMFEVNPWGRSFHEAVNNENVLIYSLSYNPVRAAIFECVAELEQEHLYFWALTDKITQPVQALDDLRHYVFAVSKSSNPDQYLTEQGMRFVLRTARPEQAVGMLFKHRADIVIGSEKSIMLHSLELGYDVKKLKKIFALAELNHPLCAAFNHNSDAEIRQRFRLAFNTLQQNGTLAEIRQRWQLTP